jgi:ketosteroid isomerase-like protein
MGNNFDTQNAQRMEDERAVQALAGRFADATNRREIPALQALWAPDGIWDLKPPVNALLKGRDNIIAMVQQLLGDYEFFLNLPVTSVIELHGDHAHARWYMHEIGHRPDGMGLNNFGLSIDEMMKLDGRWVFTKRTYQPIYFEEVKLAGMVFALPEVYH